MEHQVCMEVVGTCQYCRNKVRFGIELPDMEWFNLYQPVIGEVPLVCGDCIDALQHLNLFERPEDASKT